MAQEQSTEKMGFNANHGMMITQRGKLWTNKNMSRSGRVSDKRLNNEAQSIKPQNSVLQLNNKV